MEIEKIRVVIADDHSIFRDGLKVLFKKLKQDGFIIVAEAADGNELIDAVRVFRPQIVLTDIKMPGMGGIEATRIISRNFPGSKIIALSMFGEEELVAAMIEAGATGYLLKNTNKEELRKAIFQVNSGRPFLDKDISRQLSENLFRNKAFSNNHVKLTTREIEIVKLICMEYTNKEMAAILNLQLRTIESYRDHLIKKLDVKNTAGIVIYAVKHGIFELV